MRSTLGGKRGSSPEIETNKTITIVGSDKNQNIILISWKIRKLVEKIMATGDVYMSFDRNRCGEGVREGFRTRYHNETSLSHIISPGHLERFYISLSTVYTTCTK